MPNPSLGSRVRALRKERGLTQATAAEDIGIARGTLASIETGSDLPGRETLAAIATYYGRSIDYLVDGQCASSAPSASQVIDDPNEIALINFWRGLTTEERKHMLRLLRIDAAIAA